MDVVGRGEGCGRACDSEGKGGGGGGVWLAGNKVTLDLTWDLHSPREEEVTRVTQNSFWNHPARTALAPSQPIH